MKIVIINGSHRIGGNCYNFSKKAESIFERNHSVTVFNLIEMDIQKCCGCLDCEEGINCKISDDYSEQIMPAICEADLIVFATPTYFNMPSSALVNMINRTNNLCEFLIENPKKVLTFITGQTDETSMSEAYNCLYAYYQIMGMEEMYAPLFQVARLKQDLPLEIVQILKGI